MKNKIIYLILSVVIIILVIINISNYNNKNNTVIYEEKSLPEVKLSEGVRGSLGIDQNINESNIDDYLGRSDSVYLDVRMLEDSATWDNLEGGDKYLSGFIRGFEVVPRPYLLAFTDEYINNLKEKGVTNFYDGNSLFTQKDDNTYVANYEESLSILESIFPKDKNIFLMCGGGGYAGDIKKMLIALGWDENKIRDIGGYWYYNGKNKIETKYEYNNKTYYNFSIVPYYDINFKELHKINNEKE